MIGNVMMWCQAHPLDAVGLMAAVVVVVGLVTIGPEVREHIFRHQWR